MPHLPIPGIEELSGLLRFGTGVGVEVRGRDLRVAVVRVRPGGVRVLGYTAIADFGARPAAEWGRLYTRFLAGLGAGHLSATVLLPREEVIVRHLALPGVKSRDTESAIGFQLDTLHPYGEEDVVWGWSPLARGSVLVGVIRRPTLERYATLFAEAGVAVRSFTFSAAAVHAALRMGRAPEAFVAVNRGDGGPVEVFGRSAARAMFSAQFDAPAEHAAAVAAAELRLSADTVPVNLEQVLPVPRVNPVEHDLSRDALAYATALAGACPLVARTANLLPPERRVSSSRVVFLPAVVLATVLVLVAGAMLAYAAYSDRRYLRQLQAEIARLEPQARRAAALDRETEALRARMRLLDDFRGHTLADIEALHELTRLLAPPVWTSSIDLKRDGASLAGEAPQASGLIKIIDASPLFENSDFSVIARSQSAELFRIRTSRRGRK